MKKFYTNIPLQKAGKLDKYLYSAVGNQKLAMDETTSFPIICAMNGYVKRGEHFRIVAVCDRTEDGERNLAVFKSEVAELCKRNGAICDEIAIIDAAEDERVATHISVFQRLIDTVDDNDELFACITFGTKPASQTILMAVQYAYRLKRNTSISCIVYGKVERSASADPKDWKGYIYDETALVQLDEIVRKLADSGVENPKSVIDGILSL